MSAFELKCPNCGIALVAYENDIGAMASCAECDYHFILTKDSALKSTITPDYPDALEDIKIGQLALEGIKLVFSRNDFPASTLEELQRPEKAKELFGFKWPLLIKKERGAFEVPMCDEYVRHWKKTIRVLGDEYFLCSQWYEYQRTRLIAWIQSQGVTYGELRHILGETHENALIAKDNHVAEKDNTENQPEPHIQMDKSAEQFSFSLNNIPDDLTYTKPYKVSYSGTDYELSSWKDLLRVICTQLDNKFHKRLLALRGKPFADFSKRICLRSSKHNLLCPLKVADDLWIESNFDAKTIVKLATALLHTCEIDLASIKVFYNTSLRQKEDKQSEILEPQDISFTKKLDWSTLTMGVTIPVKLQDAFLQHLSSSLPRGSSKPVSINVDGTEYRASMVNVGFSDTLRKQVIQILWSRKSSMAEMLRMRFPEAYQKLAQDHGNRDGIDDVIIVACDSKQDAFKVSFLQSSKQEKIIVGNKVENIVSCDCLQRLLSINTNKGNQYRSGESSHKPIMCITLIYAIDKKLIEGNLFYKKSLLPIFRQIWNCLVNIGEEGNIWIPFKYLVSDGFWAINGDGAGSLDREMYEFLSIRPNRIAAVNAILHTFFEHNTLDAATLWNQLSSLPSNELPVEKDEIEKVRLVFNQHFMSGIRPGSIIDKNRFKRYYTEDTGSNLREDFPFEASLFKIGMLHEGKVFPLRSSEDAIWRKLVDELLTNGHCLLAYSRVMELHAQELMASGISSAEMLHDLIAHEANGDFEINNRYFATAGSSLNLADIITASIPEDTLLVSESELCRQYPYMCAGDIHHVLASDLRYVWNCRDIYVVGNRFIFDENEVDWILSEIRRAVSMDGYCSLAQFDFSESMSLNDPAITVNAARRVFGARYLADEYDKHGQIVSRKGEEIDGRVPLREFCRKHPEVTLEQIFAVASDFNITGYLVMAMMHEEMVRVELERFTAPSLVTFDIASIDQALASCFANKVMPLGAFRDFLRFPAVPGWSWNPYLLEAFLRRASHDFLLLTPSAASKEVAGVVVRKDDDIVDVLDACAMVAVDAALPADDESVIGDYLQQNGCILRRRASMIAEITARMKMIYEGMK